MSVPCGRSVRYAVKHTRRTIVRNQARASSSRSVEKYRTARRMASCTASSASALLPVRYIARVKPADKCGSTTLSKRPTPGLPPCPPSTCSPTWLNNLTSSSVSSCHHDLPLHHRVQGAEIRKLSALWEPRRVLCSRIQEGRARETIVRALDLVRHVVPIAPCQFGADPNRNNLWCERKVVDGHLVGGLPSGGSARCSLRSGGCVGSRGSLARRKCGLWRIPRERMIDHGEVTV